MNLPLKNLCVAAFSIALAGCAVAPNPSVPLTRATNGEAATVAETVVATDNSAELPAVALTPDILYRLLLAETALQRGHYGVGWTQYYGLAEKTRDPRLAAKATRIAVFMRENPSALKSAQLWLEIEPRNLAARQALSAAYIRSGKPEAALEHLEYVLAHEEGDSERAFMSVASLLSRERDLRSALIVMERLVASRQQNHAAWHAYAYLASRANMLDIADAAVKRSLYLKPGNPGAIILQTRIMQLNSEKAVALEYLDRQVRLWPDMTVLRLTYARQLVDSRDYDEAFTQYQVVIKQTPSDVDVLFALGLLALQLDKQESAHDYLSRARKSGQRSDDARFYLGQLEELRGDDAAALKHYSFVRRGDNLVEARVRQALITAQQGDVETARDYLHSLHLSVPAQRQRLFLVEGDILRGAGRDADVLAFYNHALTEMPGNVMLLYARALAAERLDQIDQAVLDLKTIIEREPDHIDALNALGYTLADRTNRYEEAYGYVKRALALRPDDNAILDSMGWVLYRLGRYHEAVIMLRKSLEIMPDPEVAAHLGEVLWVTGEQERAREVWRQALDSAPGDKRLLTIMERFIKQ